MPHERRKKRQFSIQHQPVPPPVHAKTAGSWSADLRSFVAIHKCPIIVSGTGPSVWEAWKVPEFQTACERTPIIAVNRAFLVGFPVTYQISVDRIWDALLRLPEVKRQHARLRETYSRWKLKHGKPVAAWTLEDFYSAYKDRFTPVHCELEAYFKLCSLHAPFKRFVQQSNFATCPYTAIPFKISNARITRELGQGLYCNANSAHTAVHLAVLLGATAVFLIGVDLAKNDPKSRPWERVVYNRDRVKKGFLDLAKQLSTLQIPIWNLNPHAVLESVPRCASLKAGLDLLERMRECRLRS